MRSIKKRLNRKNLFLMIAIVFFIVSMIIFNTVRKPDIDYILESKSYSYLPKEAKNYIKEVYEKTGEVILTEKNKKANSLYLNPQYIEYLTFSDEEKEGLGEIPISMIVDYTTRSDMEAVSVPSKYDLRTANGKNYVTPVRDQGNLGVCWTFATAGAVESHLLKTGGSLSQKLISERQLDYATSRNGIKDYKSEYVSFIDRSLGDGGNFYISTVALANGVSLFDYNSFKAYDDSDLSKMELSDVINYSKSQYEVNSTINIPRMGLRESTGVLNEEEKETRNSYLKEVKQNIMENGAAYVGTYMHSSCQYNDLDLDNVVIDVYNCKALDGHAMEIIGWDDDIEYSYCADTTNHQSDISSCNRVVSGKGVWILKNSWGESTQYPYLTYDSLYSSISFIDEMENASNKNWDNNYVLGEGTENIKEKTYYLKDTKVKDDEKIKKIKFITATPDATYNVKIYKKDGTYKTFSKKTELPGLITFDITEDIIVDKNSKIIISSDSAYIDKVSVFTSNIDNNSYIDLSKYDNMSISENEIRLYSETKNIPSNTELVYKMYDSNNQIINDKVTFKNNIVAENNINTLASFSNDLESGDYRIDVVYNSNVISSVNIKIAKMQGTGTKENPYIITNSTQLSQINDDLDGYYELGNDIDLTLDTHEGGKLSLPSNACPQGFGWKAINGFNGTLDGKGHTIKGLYQNNYLICNEDKSPTYEWNNKGNGLFGSAYGNVTIKNLVLEDFDVNCQGGYCGALLSNYKADNSNRSDTNEYTATFENIILKNSKVSGVYNSDNGNSNLRYSYGGGLFGMFESIYGNMVISNIYLDFELEPKGLEHTAYLLSNMQGKNIDIHDIQVAGNINGIYEDGATNSVLIYNAYDDDSVSLKNILSTVTGTNVGGILLYQPGDAIIKNANVLGIEDRKLCHGTCTNVTNVNIFDKDTELDQLTDKSNYSTWENFNDNWTIKTVNGIPRIPILKNVDFDYTNIHDITINQKLNDHKSIYDFIEPKIDAAKRINYKSNNENIVTIDSDGIIVPQSTGNTTIHVESWYDGYIKDVPISVTYVPHYNVYFDSNGGTGTMDKVEVAAGTGYTLPANKFTRDYYDFKEWNTKADGTGTSYADLDQIPRMSDKESITLYAQWMGEERIVTFDARGGVVSPDKKIVRFNEMYGELPIPVREGYGFDDWTGKSAGIYLTVSPFTVLNSYDLVASWRENAFTVIYDANGGKVKEDYYNIHSLQLISNSLATTYAYYNSETEIHNNIYEKSGYKFKEWNTKADGTGTAYSESQITKLDNENHGNLRLYAIWENETRTGTITYHSNDDNNDTISQISPLNVVTKLNRNTFSREGYSFKEWNTKRDGTGTSYSDQQSVVLTGDLNLYAIWEINQYQIIFNSNDGKDNTKIQTVEHDRSTKLNKNTFLKEGYEFKEWNTKRDGTGIVYLDQQEVRLTEELILYAQWTENDSYIINNYEVDDDNKYIDKININTSVDEYKKNFVINPKYSLDVGYKIIDNKKLIYTGSKTKIYDSKNLLIEYTNIIRGEVNGDGKINYLDYVMVYNHIQKIKHPELDKKILENEYFVAADMTSDGKVNYLDYVKIYNKIKELKGGVN